MTVYAPDQNQRLPAFMQGLLDTKEVLPVYFSNVLDAVGGTRASDKISTHDERQEILPENDGLTGTDGQNKTQEADAAAVIQRFFRKRYPKVKQAKAFYQTDKGKIIRKYLDMFAVVIQDQPRKITIRGHILGQGTELQMELAAITEEIKPLREKMQSIIRDAKLSPARLDSQIELRERMQTLDRSVSRLRNCWSFDTLRTQTWWFDVLKLKGELLRDEIELSQLKTALESLLQDYKKEVTSFPEVSYPPL